MQTVKNGTLARQGRKWRAENTSIRMMLRMEKKNAFMHLQTHNTHSIRWQEVVYLENEEDWKKRKIKEALIINAMDPKQIMNLEKRMEINQCWAPQHPKYCSEKGEIITPVSEISSACTICCIFIMAVREVVSVSIVFEELLMKTPLLCRNVE